LWPSMIFLGERLSVVFRFPRSHRGPPSRFNRRDGCRL
jgi:hypothetical protein